jgi:signal transduction histidine kinase
VTLRTKLLLAQLPLMVAVLAVGLLGVGTTANLSQRSQRIVKENYASLRAAYEMNAALERLNDHAATSLLNGRYNLPQNFDELKRAFEAGLDLQRGAAVEAGEEEATGEVQRAWNGYLATLRALEQAGGGQSPSIYFRSLLPALSSVRKYVDHIVTINQNAAIKKSVQSSARAMDFRAAALAVSLAALVAGLLVSLAITTRLLQPMSRLGRAVQRIGGGDFEARVSVGGRDEVTRLAGEINLMAHRLRQYRQSSLSELLLAQQASQAAIDSLPDPVLVFDLSGQLKHFNQEARGLVEGAPGGGPAQGWRVRDPALEAHLIPLLGQVLSGRGPYHPSGFEEAVKLDHGEGDRYLLPRATPVRDADDSVKGVTVLLQDVTRLRLFDQLKSDMVATVAHEFRTPLTSLRMAIYLLLEQVPGPLADKQRELLDAARGDCERVQAMVDDLLDLSRISDQGVQLRRQPLPAGELIAYALEQHRMAAHNKGLRLTAPGRDCPAQVMVDQDRVNLVFSNLLANAIRHTPAGGEVRLEAGSEGEWVRFEVIDNGEGIPVEHQEAIFRKFHGVPGAKPKGSGLGLFIARQAVRSHGGELGVESQPGQGSRFWFTLPQAPT